jgi:hypothetical protein
MSARCARQCEQGRAASSEAAHAIPRDAHAPADGRVRPQRKRLQRVCRLHLVPGGPGLQARGRGADPHLQAQGRIDGVPACVCVCVRARVCVCVGGWVQAAVQQQRCGLGDHSTLLCSTLVCGPAAQREARPSPPPPQTQRARTTRAPPTHARAPRLVQCSVHSQAQHHHAAGGPRQLVQQRLARLLAVAARAGPERAVSGQRGVCACCVCVCVCVCVRVCVCVCGGGGGRAAAGRCAPRCGVVWAEKSHSVGA